MNRDEQQLQEAIVTYLRLVMPEAIVHHSRNEGNRGGARGKIDGARGKRMGVLAGYPDLIVHWHGTTFLIEVKASNGRLSKAQRSVKENLEAQGIPYCLAKSIDDVRNFITIISKEKVHDQKNGNT